MSWHEEIIEKVNRLQDQGRENARLLSRLSERVSQLDWRLLSELNKEVAGAGRAKVERPHDECIAVSGDENKPLYFDANGIPVYEGDLVLTPGITLVCPEDRAFRIYPAQGIPGNAVELYANIQILNVWLYKRRDAMVMPPINPIETHGCICVRPHINGVETRLEELCAKIAELPREVRSLATGKLQDYFCVECGRDHPAFGECQCNNDE